MNFILKVELDEKNTEYYSLEIYKGTVLHEQIIQSEITEADEVISITKKELYLIATKHYSEEEQGPLPKTLAQIKEYVVDTTQFKNFSLIEPIDQLR